MELEIEFPDFITPLMTKWLTQYKMDIIQEITTLGLFHWDFRPNKRKPEKPRRIPRLGKTQKFIKSSFDRSIYFLEIDRATLHVFETSGFSLAGSRIAKEFILEDEKFIQKSTLLNYIS